MRVPEKVSDILRGWEGEKVRGKKWSICEGIEGIVFKDFGDNISVYWTKLPFAIRREITTGLVPKKDFEIIR